jgi:uncharacterized membrane protein (UPF0127 family)
MYTRAPKPTISPRAANVRRLLPLAAGCALAVAAPGSAVSGPGAGASPVTPIADHRPVCIRGACFESEIAVTEAERARGLMHRDALPEDRGMLFVFPEEGRHRFWMKNTRIELDIVFIGSDRRVVSISHRVPPCRREPCETYGPTADAAYALEIGGGAQRVSARGLVEFRVVGRR